MPRINTLSFSPKILVVGVAGWLLLGTAGAALGQISNAVLVGRVSDPSGAIIAGASVELKRLSTNEVFRSVTTGTGDFNIGNLPVDTYEFRVSAAGFAPHVRGGIRLEVGRTSRVDVNLTVGDVSQAVTVTAEAPILKTENAGFGQVIDNTAIVNLPLNSRDILGAFSSLTPGVAPARGTGLGGGSNLNVRGQRKSDNLVFLDGGMVSQGLGQVTFYTNPDAVQEFEVKTGLYGAEYGIKPGGQFSVVTKSGTNTPHGSLFEFLRNNALDARNFFDPGPRPPFKRNQFGAVFGAPIWLPKIFNGRNKAWFFTSYSGQRIRRFVSLTGTVPTAEEKAGRFSRSITDPLTNSPFPGNTIPASRLNPIAAKFLAFWPEPNTTGRGFNFTSPNSSANSYQDQFIAKIDWSPSETNRWSTRFVFDRSPITQTNAIQTFARVDPLRSWSQSINNTKTIQQRFVNNFGFHYYRRPYQPGARSSSPADFGKQLGIPGFPSNSSDYVGVPIVYASGFITVGDNGQTGIAVLGQWEIRDSLTFNWKAHSFKIGYHGRRHYEFLAYNGRSNFTFNQVYSGHAFANLLLGYPSSAVQGADRQRGRFAQTGHYGYFADSWKATARLTFDLGLRYEYRGPWKDRGGFGANFDPATGTLFPALQNLTLRPWESGRFLPNVPLIEWNKRGILPRVGLGYRVTSKTVLRAGYGAYTNEPGIHMVQTLGANPRPNAVQRTFQSDPRVPSLLLSDPFNLSAEVPGGGLPNLVGEQARMPQSLVHTWGLSIQQQLTPNTVFEIGYQGSHSVHDFTVTEFNDAVPGTGPRQQRRPYPQYQSVSMVLPNADANYNGLELRLERRPGKSGFSALLAYTWSKAIDSVGGRLAVSGDPGTISRNTSLKANRGLSEGNIPGRLALMAGYELPFGAGKKFLTSGPMGKIAGGWVVSGILTLESGPYLTPVLNVDRLDVGSTASSRPDALRNPDLPDSERLPQRWFDPAAFALPSTLRYGNAGRSIIKGPGVANFDVSLLRSFRITEASRLEFRFEGFNITNHTNFGFPGTTFGTTTFGVIGSALEARDLQFGLKLYF